MPDTCSCLRYVAANPEMVFRATARSPAKDYAKSLFQEMCKLAVPIQHGCLRSEQT